MADMEAASSDGRRERPADGTESGSVRTPPGAGTSRDDPDMLVTGVGRRLAKRTAGAFETPASSAIVSQIHNMVHIGVGARTRAHYEKGEASAPPRDPYRRFLWSRRNVLVRFVFSMPHDYTSFKNRTASLAVNYFDRWSDCRCKERQSAREAAHLRRRQRQHWQRRVLASMIPTSDGLGLIVSFVEAVPEPTVVQQESERAEWKREVKRVSAACVYVAAKFDTTLYPHPEELLRYTNIERFGVDELCLVETDLLMRLDWSLHASTPYDFSDLLYELCGSRPPRDLDVGEGATFQQTWEWAIEASHYSTEHLDEAPWTMAASSLVVAWWQVDVRLGASKRASENLGMLARACLVTEGHLLGATQRHSAYLCDRFPAEYSGYE